MPVFSAIVFGAVLFSFPLVLWGACYHTMDDSNGDKSSYRSGY